MKFLAPLSPTLILPGDLLFYQGSSSLIDRLICWRTQGPYAHVEICAAPGLSVGALPPGVLHHALETKKPIHVARTSLLCPRVGPALTWLAAQTGGYSWLDILNFLLPFGLFFTDHGRYDCSDLATQFLAQAGYPLPQPLRAHPGTVSPNALARVVGLLV